MQTKKKISDINSDINSDTNSDINSDKLFNTLQEEHVLNQISDLISNIAYRFKNTTFNVSNGSLFDQLELSLTVDTNKIIELYRELLLIKCKTSGLKVQ